MPAHDYDALLNADVQGSDGERIGAVNQLFLDDQTQNPSWVTVVIGVFGRREHFIPLADAQFRDGAIHVPYEKAQITAAPALDVDQHLSRDDEDVLFDYYAVQGRGGMPPATDPVADEDPAAEAPTAQPSDAETSPSAYADEVRAETPHEQTLAAEPIDEPVPVDPADAPLAEPVEQPAEWESAAPFTATDEVQDDDVPGVSAQHVEAQEVDPAAEPEVDDRPIDGVVTVDESFTASTPETFEERSIGTDPVDDEAIIVDNEAIIVSDETASPWAAPESAAPVDDASADAESVADHPLEDEPVVGDAAYAPEEDLTGGEPLAPLPDRAGTEPEPLVESESVPVAPAGEAESNETEPAIVAEAAVPPVVPEPDHGSPASPTTPTRVPLSPASSTPAPSTTAAAGESTTGAYGSPAGLGTANDPSQASLFTGGGRPGPADPKPTDDDRASGPGSPASAATGPGSAASSADPRNDRVAKLEDGLGRAQLGATKFVRFLLGEAERWAGRANSRLDEWEKEGRLPGQKRHK
ncbi:PRC-barrel domain-containing protein [Naumannella halotolerans]|uniref:PRC-barrel domain protein n=1 Tax=Naumannella halotolerans TaxID=993414 RepID=A0A4R7J1G3_9ACTN|nr:PRC-barrel domain-containing protein [Naumannella halotolerans]TDT30992.1 PRC-barrel domain protein [Naumannella halotolerans]